MNTFKGEVHNFFKSILIQCLRACIFILAAIIPPLHHRLSVLLFSHSSLKPFSATPYQIPSDLPTRLNLLTCSHTSQHIPALIPVPLSVHPSMSGGLYFGFLRHLKLTLTLLLDLDLDLPACTSSTCTSRPTNTFL